MIHAILEPVVVLKFGQGSSLLVPVQEEGSVAALAGVKLVIEQLDAIGGRCHRSEWGAFRMSFVSRSLW